MLLWYALAARAAADGGDVLGSSALPTDTTHESPEPALTTCGSLLTAEALVCRPVRLLSRAAQSLALAPDAARSEARGVAPAAALLRAFARDRMTRR